jgi:formate-dependent nitrite reductase membrane component NrfD
MMLLADAEHFAGAPEWTWYILFYFFLAGLAGGSYFLGTLLRHWGTLADEQAARLGFYVAFPAILISPLLLTLDLTKPLRFWHMLWNTTPGNYGPILKLEAPMSVGVWALTVAGIFTLVSFADALVRDGKIRHPLARRLAARFDGTVGLIWNIAGSLVLLFIASYTGVLLAVSNQPVWSDSWVLGGLFLASGLTGSAALLLLLTRYRRGAEPSRGFLEIGERLFAALELLVVVVFVLTLIDDGTLDKAFAFPWILLWVAALAGMLPGLRDLAIRGLGVTAGGAVATERALVWAAVPSLVLVSVLALRAAVIFSAQ